MINAAHILLAAEDPDFASLVRLGFQESGILNPVHVVNDGREAIRYLDGDMPFADRIAYPLPALLLLEVRLRLVSGFDVLQWVREQPALAGIGVILFSSLGTEEDAQLAHELGADYFMDKPFDFPELVNAVERIAGAKLVTMNFCSKPFVSSTRAVT